MSFFARLKWLFTGEGEAPSNFKSTQHPGARRPDQHGAPRQGFQGRDRGDNRDRERNPRDRDSRGGRHPRDSRDSRSRSPRGNFNREGGNDRYSERDRGEHGPRRSGPQGSGHSRRDRESFGAESNFPRPIERPTGGPSSTMRPAYSSAQDVVAAPAPRVETQQGPEKIGVVLHYFDQARVASIKIEKGSIRSGDWIEIQGNISSLRQKVDSMQLDNQPIQEAHENQEVGIRVIRPVKSGDAIVRLRG